MDILSDPTKFSRLMKDSTEALNKRISSLVTCANKLQQEMKFPKNIGDYKPGHCYGSVKTHKSGNPLRPISQRTSPTYRIEFIDILRTTETDEDIASLDAESLFTHIPVQETIGIILDNLRTEGNFRQVLRWDPLGVIFADMYIAAVETRTFIDHQRPRIYARYADDIFVTVKENDTRKLDDALKANSALNFTIEGSLDRTLPSLITLKTVHAGLERVKQMLMNNEFPGNIIEDSIRKNMEEFLT
ncbi:uncharacterized protein LOC143023084 [Oratosquilla oratoria]|uniref:uncharacterized protein LOC143023084 n=1 Tax=Oratosquilla oratoria TaxID=337810 RepID=UPI003F772406